MILVTHEMKFARNVANHIVFLAEGVIDEQGTPDEIFGNPKSERLKKFISSIH
jgi:octopine/nopaline transport system ATP-binding protein